MVTAVPNIKRIAEVEAVLRDRVPADEAAATPRELYDCMGAVAASLSALADWVAEIERQCGATLPATDESKLQVAESHVRQASAHAMSFRWDLGRDVGADVMIQTLDDSAPRRAEPGD
ncbi:hypothetical protein [Nocardia sp. NPDC051570]|uniref:hypothetical protein n=1 Tax=Nocardia sp. NPDC051570 TaxID=3364324 RepID=UPI0037949467